MSKIQWLNAKHRPENKFSHIAYFIRYFDNKNAAAQGSNIVAFGTFL